MEPTIYAFELYAIILFMILYTSFGNFFVFVTYDDKFEELYLLYLFGFLIWPILALFKLTKFLWNISK